MTLLLEPIGSHQQQKVNANNDGSRRTTFVERQFERIGYALAKWPWLFIVATFAIGSLSFGMKYIHLEDRIKDGYTPVDADSYKEELIYAAFFTTDDNDPATSSTTTKPPPADGSRNGNSKSAAPITVLVIPMAIGNLSMISPPILQV